jgi:hypothetical protein
VPFAEPKTVSFVVHRAEAVAAAATGLPAAAAAAPPATTSATRTEYAAQLDPICQSYEKPVNKLVERFVKRTRGLLKQQIEGDVAQTEGRLLRAFGRLFQDSTKLVGRMTNQISAVPPPPGDEMTIAAWLQSRRAYGPIVRSAARAARSERANRMLALLGKAGRTVTAGDQLVASFGFRQCA